MKKIMTNIGCEDFCHREPFGARRSREKKDSCPPLAELRRFTPRNDSRFFIVALIVVAFLSAISFSVAMAETKQIEDMVGRKINISKTPERIVCIGPGALRLISYMNLQDKVVGIEELEVKNPGGRPYWLSKGKSLEKLPIIGPGGPASINNIPNLEAIISVSPDLIFVTFMESKKADSIQKKIGIPVVVLDYGSFAAFSSRVYDSFNLLGKMFGKEDRAKEVVGFIESKRIDLANRAKGVVNKPSVYIGGLGFKGGHGIESSDSTYVPFEWLSLDNVSKKVKKEGHLFTSKEELLKLNPEIIFLDGGGLKLVLQDYQKNPDYYKALKAFKDGKVYKLFPFNWYTTNIGTTIADAYAIGKIVYPEKFKDIDIKNITNEIYTKLTGSAVYNEMLKSYGELGSKMSPEK